MRYAVQTLHRPGIRFEFVLAEQPPTGEGKPTGVCRTRYTLQMTLDELKHSIITDITRERTRPDGYIDQHDQDYLDGAEYALSRVVSGVIFGATRESICTTTMHDTLNPGAFTYCPECGIDLREWRAARSDLQKDIARMEDGH
jgi:hypothetical protein